MLVLQINYLLYVQNRMGTLRDASSCNQQGGHPLYFSWPSSYQRSTTTRHRTISHPELYFGLAKTNRLLWFLVAAVCLQVEDRADCPIRVKPDLDGHESRCWGVCVGVCECWAERCFQLPLQHRMWFSFWESSGQLSLRQFSNIKGSFGITNALISSSLQYRVYSETLV